MVTNICRFTVCTNWLIPVLKLHMYRDAMFYRLRAKYGTDIKANALHGSSNVLHAADNIKMMFGDIEFNADGTVKGIFLFLLLLIKDGEHFWPLK